MENYHQNRPTNTTNPPPGFGGFLNQTKVVGNNRRALREIGNAVDVSHSFAINNKNVLENKRSLDAIGVHRPITRSFAATLKSQSASQVLTHNPILAPSYPCHDQLLPMVEEKGEVDPCEPKEIEMEDITVDETMLDIDSVDRNNSLAVVDYVEDIYSYYRKMEEHSCVSPDYMSNQFDINDKMRAILIDWLIEVHYKFELMEETLYLTVSIIDRFLAQQSVVRKKLQLVGVTAMLLACKYEEVSVPVVEDLVLISDRAYTRKEVLDMEKLIINTLRFNLSFPTLYVFIRRFLKAANSDRELELLSYFIIELSLVEFTVLKFRPSLLAAAAIYTALSALRGRNHWNNIIGFHTCYTEEQLLECSKMMVEFHHYAGAGKLTATFRKYNSFKFGFASKIKPALFLLDAIP